MDSRRDCSRLAARRLRWGRKAVGDAKPDKFAKGRIALQHGKGVTGVVKFRKLQTKTP